MRQTYALAGILACGLFVTAKSNAADPPSQVVHLPAAKLQEEVSKLGGGAVPHNFGPDAVAFNARREVDGQVEIHMEQNDLFIGHSGSATIVVGGYVEGNRLRGPGEWIGGTISGGVSYDIGPGDMLWVPAGIPHQVFLKGGPFNHITIKFNQKPALPK
jgi:mannose-6-phosphate isomerase-like protein (cupin superfamily)